MNRQRRLRSEALIGVSEFLATQWPGLVGRWELTGGDEPRFVAQDGGDRIVVDVRVAKYENAGRFRGWLTMGAAGVRAMHAERPVGWRFFTVVVGLLPDGLPWWVAMWDMAEVVRHWDRAESMHDGYWYRLNPGHVPESARPVIHDYLQTELPLDFGPLGPEPDPDDAFYGVVVPALFGNLNLVDRMVDWEAGIPNHSDSDLREVDAVMLRVRRMIRSESERRARTPVTV